MNALILLAPMELLNRLYIKYEATPVIIPRIRSNMEITPNDIKMTRNSSGVKIITLSTASKCLGI